jgi:leucyl aminopeptidase
MSAARNQFLKLFPTANPASGPVIRYAQERILPRGRVATPNVTSKKFAAAKWTTIVRFVPGPVEASAAATAKNQPKVAKVSPYSKIFGDDFQGKKKQIAVQYSVSNKQRIIFVGLGSDANRGKPTPLFDLKAAVHQAVAKLKELKVDNAVFILPPPAWEGAVWKTKPAYDIGALHNPTDVISHTRYRILAHRDAKVPFHIPSEGHRRFLQAHWHVEHVARWIVTANYRFLHYNATKEAKEHHFLKEVDIGFLKDKKSHVVLPKKSAEIAIARGSIIGTSMNHAKHLGNLRPDNGTPDFYVEYAKALTRSYPAIKLSHHLRGEQLLKKGLEMHYNVGKGATVPPSLVVLEYNGAPKQSKSVALVGKGITFDTGGLHLKPFGSMEDMHLDMMGAATVLSALEAVAALKLKVNVACAVALAENAIGPGAYRPSTIIRSLKGTTVEILNTDAEGRLVLGDALTFVQSKSTLKKPAAEIIDVATLTGAVLIALGKDRAAIFSNSDALRRSLYTCGIAVDEPLWPLPIGPEHDERMKGTLSDLKNIPGDGRDAGSSTAAAFLKHFINDGVEWAHLDIAGAGMNDKLLGCQPKGAPGYGVNLLVEYLTRKAAANH